MKALRKNIFVIPAVLLATSLAMPAHCANQKDTTTDFDDDIKATDFADGSGFQIEGGGATFTYDYHTKVMTMTSKELQPEASLLNSEKKPMVCR